MNIGDLYSESLAAVNAATDLILVSPEKYTGFTESTLSKNTVGFKFQIVGDEVLNLQSDITDHYAEDNSSIQDHIALRPIRFTVSGFIGELTNEVPDALEAVKETADRLGTLSYYLPSISNTAQRIYNTAIQVYQLGQKIKNAGAVSASVKVQTKQEKAYQDLEKLWRNRTLFWVATPYGQFSNMAIENISVTQSADSKFISDFSITFKEVKFSKVSLATKDQSGRISDIVVNKGQGVG